jgi:hypothetical protein
LGTTKANGTRDHVGKEPKGWYSLLEDLIGPLSVSLLCLLVLE